MGIKCFVCGIKRELSYHSEEKTKKEDRAHWSDLSLNILSTALLDYLNSLVLTIRKLSCLTHLSFLPLLFPCPKNVCHGHQIKSVSFPF